MAKTARKLAVAPPPTDAEVLTIAGNALYGGEWNALMGAALDLPKTVIKDIRREHGDLYPDQVEKLQAMLDQRSVDIKCAKTALKAWIKHHLP